eukprot:13708257-Alexandrium_andersonii.AAC.1
MHVFCRSCSDDWLTGWQDVRAHTHLRPWPGRGELGKMKTYLRPAFAARVGALPCCVSLVSVCERAR